MNGLPAVALSSDHAGLRHIIGVVSVERSVDAAAARRPGMRMAFR